MFKLLRCKWAACCSLPIVRIEILVTRQNRRNANLCVSSHPSHISLKPPGTASIHFPYVSKQVRWPSHVLHVDIDQDRLSYTFNFGNYTFQVESFREHDFEYLLYIYWSWCWAEYQRRVHGTCKTLCLNSRTEWEIIKRMKSVELTCLVISSCSSRGKVANWSNFVPIRKGIAVWKNRLSTNLTVSCNTASRANHGSG